MIIKSIVSVCLAFGLFFSAQAQAFFQNTDNCQKAYEHIIALRIDSGKHFLELEEKNNSNNLYPLLLHNYIDFLDIFCSGESQKMDKAKKVFDQRIKTIKNSHLNTSPYYIYIQAEIQLQTAILLVNNNQYFNAIFYLRRALNLLEDNEEYFPEFKPNQKSLGLLYSVLGSVPEQFKTGLSLIGLSRDLQTGMQKLKTLSNDSSFIYQHEATTIYAFLLFHLNNEKEKAWQILQANNFAQSNSLMDKYAVGHIGIYGLHTNDALNTLLAVKPNADYINFPMINYLIGLGKTYRQDEDANDYLQQFVTENKGQDHLKTAYQKMAWNELIKGNEQKYTAQVNNIRVYGRTLIDADKQAQKELDLLTLPNRILLKARLLADGNYAQEAFDLLNKYKEETFLMPKEKLEYQYRLGRIYHKLGNTDRALKAYEKTIEKNIGVEAYFGANACYLIANIYEKNGDKEQALAYYNQCLKMNGYEYHNSIMQKAKAGKNRIYKRLF